MLEDQFHTRQLARQPAEWLLNARAQGQGSDLGASEPGDSAVCLERPVERSQLKGVEN